MLKIQTKERDANTPNMFYPVQDIEQKFSVTFYNNNNQALVHHFLMLENKAKRHNAYCSAQLINFSFAVLDEPPSLESGWSEIME